MLFKIFTIVLSMLLYGCFEKEGSAPFVAATCQDTTGPDTLTDTANLGSLSAGCFSAYSTSPIFQSGSFFSNAQWNDPHVFKLGGRYIMYASASEGFNENIKIYNHAEKSES